MNNKFCLTITLAVIAFGVVACATQEKFLFDTTTPGFTQEQFNMDFHNCDPTVKYPNLPSQLIRPQVIKCMSAKGYIEISPNTEPDKTYCMKGDECDDMWAQALAFGRRQFARELFYESDTLIRSTDPAVEEAERKDGSRPIESKMIIRRNNLGGGKYEIDFDFKCGTSCPVSSEEEKRNFAAVMKRYQQSRPKAAISSPTINAKATPQASGSISVEDQLQKLQDMHDKKIITDKEYKAMRAKVLGL